MHCIFCSTQLISQIILFQNRTKVKRRKLKQEKVKKKRGRPSGKDKKSTDDADEDDESDHEGNPEQATGTWQVICFTEEDWEKLAAQLKGSTVKEEKALYRVLAEDFLPEIPRLFAEKERLQRYFTFYPVPSLVIPTKLYY